MVGYCRTSKGSQNNGIEVQKEALEKYNVDFMFIEQVSGRKEDRKELAKALDILEKGDTLICYKIDRLGRSTKQLINIMSDLKEKGVNVIFIKENIDTATAYGQLVFTILSAIAELEASFISERTKEGLSIVKSKGKRLGNKPLSQKVEDKIIEKLRQDNLTQKQIALQCNVSIRTVQNVKKRNKDKIFEDNCSNRN